MKTIKNVILTLVIAATLNSCSNEDEDYSVQRFSRNITFKIIGEYSGNLTVAYANPTSENGVTPSEVSTALPWQKNVFYNRKIKLTGLSVTGLNGKPNENVQLQVYANGELVETEYGVADEQGGMYAETSTIYFK